MLTFVLRCVVCCGAISLTSIQHCLWSKNEWLMHVLWSKSTNSNISTVQCLRYYDNVQMVHQFFFFFLFVYFVYSQKILVWSIYCKSFGKFGAGSKSFSRASDTFLCVCARARAIRWNEITLCCRSVSLLQTFHMIFNLIQFID